MHLRPRKKLAAQLKTVWRPAPMRGFYHTLVTKRPNYLVQNLKFVMNCTKLQIVKAKATMADVSTANYQVALRHPDPEREWGRVPKHALCRQEIVAS